MNHQDLRRYGLLLGLSIGCGGAPEGELFAPRDGAPAALAPVEASNVPEHDPSAAENEPGIPSELAATGSTLPSDQDTSARERQDPTPSQVLWTAPADGETGVLGNRDVQLQFSEPMNIASVEAALSTTLPGELSRTWEGGATLLRLRSSMPLAYAAGIASEALAFSVSVSDAARSISGKRLAPSTLVFRTLRRIQLTLEPSRDLGLTGVALGTGPEPLSTVGQAAPPCSPGSICAGDLSAPSGDGIQVKSFLTFDLESLPVDAQLESARLRLLLEQTVGNPFGQRGLGSLHVERSWFSHIDPSAFGADSDATVAVLSDGAESAESQDISWVIEEARERGLSQYRLTFPQTTNRDTATDLAILLPSRQQLELTYLIP